MRKPWRREMLILAAMLSVVSLQSAASTLCGGGRDFSPAGAVPLFRLFFCREDDFLATNSVSAVDAKSFSDEARDDCRCLVYRDVGPAERVVCTIRRDGEKTRWRISVNIREGWALERTEYPVLPVAPSGLPGGDSLLVGSNKGGIVRDAAARLKEGDGISFLSPGALASQFACLWNDNALFYFVAEDPNGDSKWISVRRTAEGFVFSSTRNGWETIGDTSSYDVVTASLARRGALPCDWHDAADLYRDWAERQEWCAAKYLDREDVPAWMKDAPVFSRLLRYQIEKPEVVKSALEEFRRDFPGAPLVVSLWGWEKTAPWVAPDYFPCHPDDDTFARLVGILHEKGAHAFPWPSGYNWTLSYGKGEDGSFAFADRETFRRRARAHAVSRRYGGAFARSPKWLRGGETAVLCGGDKWTRSFFNREVVAHLAAKGCEMLQVDQVVGGAFPACWSRAHGHPPGEGRWKKDSFAQQLVSLRDTMRKNGVERPVIGFEEPCELFNGLVSIQDYRDCETENEIASVFNYIYHEYLPVFQSNLGGSGDVSRLRLLHCAVDGQMPWLRLSSSKRRTKGNAGDPDAHERRRLFDERWVSLFRGEGRAFLAYGRHERPPVADWMDGDRTVPLLCAAYRARDGRRAIVIGSDAPKRQTARLVSTDGTECRVTLEPGLNLSLYLHGEIFGNKQKKET